MQRSAPLYSYGVRPPTADGAPGQVWVADALQHALEAPGGGADGDGDDATSHGGGAPLQRLHGVAPRQVYATSPPLDFHVTMAAASANGHQLLLMGASAEVRAKERGRAGRRSRSTRPAASFFMARVG